MTKLQETNTSIYYLPYLTFYIKAADDKDTMAGIRYIYTSNIASSVSDVGPALQPPEYPGQNTARSPENVLQM